MLLNECVLCAHKRESHSNCANCLTDARLCHFCGKNIRHAMNYGMKPPAILYWSDGTNTKIEKSNWLTKYTVSKESIIKSLNK